jgi:hypothetical protein
MRRQKFLSVAKILSLFLLLALLLAPNWPAFGDEKHQLNALIGLRQFDFLVWELNAFRAKAAAILSNGHAFLDEETRKQVVLDYLETVGVVNRLNWEIERAYTDPQIADPAVATQALQEELAARRAEMARLQPLAEAIVQEQVGALLREQGLSLGGRAWPPVLMHMTPLPTVLIVSPRDRIERQYQIPLVTGLVTPEKEGLETAVFQSLNLSALVVPIGGMATYPAMIMEGGNINWLADVVAHEWAHHWMTPYPVSLNYFTEPAVQTINETVASIVGREIGPQVVARYYPELLPPLPVESVEGETAVTEPPPFNFRAELAATRVEAERLLAAGDIEGAEAYMEARRRLFVANGYNVRKLNQAYFAFYGAYAAEPGAAGDDPVGPTVLAIREASPSLKEFLRTMAWVGSLEDLQTAAERAVNSEQ